MFKRIFILYIQMAFLLPSTITKVSPVHIAPIFEMEKITERNWGAHRRRERKKLQCPGLATGTDSSWLQELEQK
ncbi:hypothetical protein Ahy_B06g084301 isoform B [Arachis hypogaea]|uniref:Secreted protein n=1 Tax=Arachis hypogaea TaxID=3818 RepID=A0A444YRJ7_ARAHY|nr:hypothetical protein Ahy_B06g084301 isoform B [Arachis hypogaea]